MPARSFPTSPLWSVETGGQGLQPLSVQKKVVLVDLLELGQRTHINPSVNSMFLNSYGG